MKNLNKVMAIMPLAASMVAPMSAFAATSYTTSEAAVLETQTVEGDASGEEARQVEVSVTQASAFSISIPKRITLNGAKGATNDSDYNVKVAGNIASDEMITVTPVATFKMSDTKGVKTDLNAEVTQAQTKFINEAVKGTSTYTSNNDYVGIKVEQADTPAVTGNVKVLNLTAGSWAGQFNFDIKLDKIK